MVDNDLALRMTSSGLLHFGTERPFEDLPREQLNKLIVQPSDSAVKINTIRKAGDTYGSH